MLLELDMNIGNYFFFTKIFSIYAGSDYGSPGYCKDGQTIDYVTGNVNRFSNYSHSHKFPHKVINKKGKKDLVNLVN